MGDMPNDWGLRDHASCIHQTSDGGYILAGETYGAENYDVWVLKTVAWQKTLAGVMPNMPIPSSRLIPHTKREKGETRC